MATSSSALHGKELNFFEAWCSRLSNDKADRTCPSTVTSVNAVSAVEALLVLRKKLVGCDSSTNTSAPRPQLQVYGTGAPLHRSREQTREVSALQKVLSMFGSLEYKRQECEEACAKEKALLNYLQKKLDQEEQQRLVVLQDAVQKEHESSIRDITDLRCLSTLNERERDRVKAGLDDVVKEKEILKANSIYWNSQLPKMEDKISKENDNIEEIREQQEEAAKEVKFRADAKSEKEALYCRTIEEANEEERTLLQEYGQLLQKRNDFIQLRLTQQSQLQTALKDIVNWEEELERGAVEMKSLDGAIEEADKNVEAQKKITSAWKMKEEELWTELGRRKQYSEAVREEICNQQNFQEEALESQRSELRACVRSLHCSRQNNDLLQHKRDKLTQELHAVEQKKKDAAREEVRYSEETSRVDQQLEVAMGQYTLVKQDHLSLAQSLRAKQEQVRDSDLHWKATLEGIEEQRREEVKIRTVFESKLSFDQDDMEKLLKEQMKKKSRANRILEEWNKKTSIQKTITGVAESDHQKWLTTVEDVENKLRSLSEELLKVEKEFDNFKTNLLSRLQAAKLTYSQAQRDIQELEATTSQLRDSIEDVGRCLAVLVHSVDKADLRLESLAQENKDLDKHSRVALDDVAKLSQLKMDFDNFLTKAQDQYCAFISEQLRRHSKLEVAVQESLISNRCLSVHYIRKSQLLLREKVLCLREANKLRDTSSVCTHHKQLKEGQKRSHDAHSACNDAWLSWGECTLGAHHHRGRQSLTAVEEITHRLKSTAISIGMYVESHLKNNSLLNIPYSEQC